MDTDETSAEIFDHVEIAIRALINSCTVLHDAEVQVRKHSQTDEGAVHTLAIILPTNKVYGVDVYLVD